MCARKLLAIAVLLLPLLAGADVVKAAYEGRLGNPEEPALRPYKGIWRGVKALIRCPLEAVAEGNRKFPVLGTVEVFRGLRRGTIEFATNSYAGMAGSLPKEVDYRSKPNVLVESKPLGAAALDTATGALVLGGSGASGSVLKAAVGVCAAQQIVDRSPLGAPPQKAETAAEKDKPSPEASSGPVKTPQEQPGASGQTELGDAGDGAAKTAQ